MHHMRQSVAIGLAAVCAVLAFAAVIEAQLSSAADDEQTVRVIVRLAEDGRVEFGLRTADGDLSPRGRYFPRTVTHNRWLVSRPVALSDGTDVRIIARRSPDGRIEFGIRTNGSDEDLLPRGRYFPSAVSHNRWLQSTPLTLPVQTVVQQVPEDAETQGDSDPRPDDDDIDNQVDKVADGYGEPAPERLSGGHRDGLIVNRNVVGDPDAPVLIAEYGDPY